MIVSMDTPLFELVEGEGEKEKVTPLFSVMDIAVRADEMFTILMGDVVEPRKNYIVDHALNVRNLDV